jgi:hypothetical protein
MEQSLKLFPELTGVLFLIPEGATQLEIMREVALVRTKYVAVIGAVFVQEGEGFDEARGVRICRKIGIPYLFSAHVESPSQQISLDPATLHVLANMV